MTAHDHASIASELFADEPTGMQWQAVESSQIEAIGYESGADYPLGIKFPPNKKQAAAGLPGSEYRYKGVAHDMFIALSEAESVGKFFGEYIKSHADLYPFVKVEADPTPPPSSPNGGGSPSTKGSTTSGRKSTTTIEATTTDTASPGSGLAVIDSLSPDALFAPGGVTDAQLAAGRTWFLTEAKKYDISTDEKRAELKRFARPLQKLRTGIEARAKEFTGETKRKLAAIDTEKRRLVDIVGGIETEVLRPLTTWELEEESRKIRLARIANELADKGQRFYQDIPSLEAAIKELEGSDLSTMQEYKVSAESGVAASLRVLNPELARRQEAERNARELEELRAERVAREERDRQAEAERLEADRVAQFAADAKVEAERQVAASLAASEARAKDAESRAAFAVHQEQLRAAAETARIERESQARAADKANRLKIDNEALGAICALDIPMDRAQDLLIDIVNGRIPHVTISY